MSKQRKLAPLPKSQAIQLGAGSLTPAKHDALTAYFKEPSEASFKTASGCVTTLRNCSGMNSPVSNWP